MRAQLKVKDGKFRCSSCKEWKDSSEFYIDRRSKHGVTCVCKACKRIVDKAKKLKSRYNLTEADVFALLEKQDNKCAVCGISIAYGGVAAVKPHIDHNHKTGDVRGILCMQCNIAAGHVKDCHKTAHKLMKYLKNGGVT